MEYKGKEISYEILDAIAYQKLEKEFTDLGIKDVWKPGSKKADMINNALKKLQVLKGLLNSGMNEDEIAKALTETLDKEDKLQKQAELQKEEEKELKEKNQEEQVKEMDLSREVIEANLKRIQASLRGGVPSQRNILLNKKNMLLKMLDELE